MYYVLDRFWAIHPARWIGKFPHDANVNWDLGRRHTAEIPVPLRFELTPLDLDASDQGPAMPEMFKGHVPLFRDDLLSAMRDAGVDNLDVYDVEILDPDSGEKHTNYKAVNIIGAVSAVDMEASNATVHPGGPVLDVELEGFVVDASRVGELLIFRLAENTGAVMVHEQLADYLDERGFEQLEYLDPSDVAL